MLKRDPQLVHAQGQYQGRLCFPYGYGVVLANVTRQQWDSAVAELAQERLLPAHRVTCEDEMAESVEPEDFHNRPGGRVECRFDDRLSLAQLDGSRWQLVA